MPAYYIVNPAEAAANLARFDSVKYGLSVREGAHTLEEMYERTRGQGEVLNELTGNLGSIAGINAKAAPAIAPIAIPEPAASMRRARQALPLDRLSLERRGS